MNDESCCIGVESLPNADACIESLFAHAGYESKIPYEEQIDNLNHLYTYLSAIRMHSAPFKVPMAKALSNRGIMIRARCISK